MLWNRVGPTAFCAVMTWIGPTPIAHPSGLQHGSALQLAPVPSGRLEYEVRGQGEPVLFVHGAVVADLLQPLASESVFSSYRTVRLHRRGYAGSSPVDPTWSVEQDAADLAALLRHLGITRAHVVAHSAGGVVAMEFATTFPEMVQTLTLLDPPLNFMQAQELQPRTGGADGIEQFFLSRGGPDLRQQLETRLPGALQQARRDERRFNAVEWLALGAWAYDEAKARKVTAPVLFLSQQHSPLVDTLQRYWPTMQFVEISGATHMFPFERSTATAATIAGFLSQHRMR